jgi:large subunit ribosomal protein L4
MSAAVPGVVLRSALYDQSGARIGDVELAPAVFGLRAHRPAMHEGVVWQLAARRRGTHSTLTRGEVSRSTKKIYRQKGTGRARHGSRGAPVFVGGGVSHGPRPRGYAYPLPRKVRRLAIRSALSTQAADGRIMVIDRLPLERPRSGVLAKWLRAVGAGGSVLLVTAQPNEVVRRSAANIPGVRVASAASLNVHDVLASSHLVFTRDALDRATEALAP